MLAAEGEPPYDRPPLSKDVLAWRDVSLSLRHVRRSRYRPSTGCSGNRARGWRGADRRRPARVRRCGGCGGGQPHLHCLATTTLRTLDDAHDLRDSLEMGAEVAIIGAGWIGAEVACAAAENGCSVTVYEAADSPLSAALPTDLGMRTVQWYEQLGISAAPGRAGRRCDEPRRRRRAGRARGASGDQVLGRQRDRAQDRGRRRRRRRPAAHVDARSRRGG